MATSYSNRGGTGARTTFITVTCTGISFSGTPVNLLNGSMDNGFFFSSSAVAGAALKFYFPACGASGVIIDEAKWYQDNSVTHGTWKWQGSNDDSSWTDIGSSFTLGGTAQVQTQLNGNTTPYIYYRLLGVSGSASSSPWLYEIEFKIDPQLAMQSAIIIGTPVTDTGKGTKHQPVTMFSSAAFSPGTSAPVPVGSILAGGTTGVAYTEAITVNGGTSPYTFSVTSGSLPTGLTLSSGGVISGTPTGTGTSTFTIRVTDSNGNVGSQVFSITIASATSSGVSNYGFVG